VEAVEALIRFGADIHLVDMEGNSALMLAAAKSSGGCVQKLLQAGANPLTRNKAKKNAKEIAEGNPKDKSVVETLARATAAQESLFVAIDKGEADGILRAIKSGANPRNPGETGKTALTVAIEKQFADGVSRLLQNGADPTEQEAALAATSPNPAIVQAVGAAWTKILSKREALAAMKKT
jgi:ankyrin repeat protein